MTPEPGPSPITLSSTANISGERDTSLMAITVLLGVIQRSYKAAADKSVAHFGISQALAWPLVMIGRHEDGVRHGTVAGLLGIEGPSLVRSVDQLVTAGLVERRNDPGDLRATRLFLTDAGRATQQQIEAVLRGLRASIFDGIPDTDLAAFLRVFATLEQRLQCVMPAIPGAI